MAVVSRSHEPGLDTAENSAAAENCAHPCAHRSDTLPRPPIVLTIQLCSTLAQPKYDWSRDSIENIQRSIVPWSIPRIKCPPISVE